MNWSHPFEQLSVGERFQSAGRTVRDTDVIVFCALTGDWHPQHCDPDWAALSPFGERIAHGMLVLSMAVGLVPLDPQRVIALRRVSDVVFKRPVRLDDTIAVSGEIAALRPVDAHTGLVDFDWQIRNQDGQLVCRAGVQVLWRREPALAGGEPPAGGGERGERLAGAPAQGDQQLAGSRAAAGELWHEAITGGAAPGEFTPLPL